jgi:hypothetical protein
MTNTTLATIAMLVGLAIPSTGQSDCYGLREPNALEQMGENIRANGTVPRDLRGAYARNCVTIRSLIDCGMQQRDAVAMVVNRQAMEGYIANFIAKCAVARANTTAAPPAPPLTPGQPAPWLAEMNKTKSSRTGIEDGVLYCHNIVMGIEKPWAPNHVHDCLAWYGNSIRGAGQ